MKKILKLNVAFFLVLLLTVALFPRNAFADQNNKTYVERTTELGITIPNEIRSLSNIEEILQGLYEKAEKNVPNTYNYKLMGDLYESIKEKITPQIITTADITAAAYTMKHSKLYSSWSQDLLEYNCYGHSIGMHRWLQPGSLSNRSFSMSYSISTMADLVVRDLDATLRGEWSIYKTTNKPSSIPSGGKVICIRKGIDDFHFMRALNSTSRWTHKPGNTQILEWRYTTPNYVTWTNEAVFKGVPQAPDTSYTSTIYYIVAKPLNYSR